MSRCRLHGARNGTALQVRTGAQAGPHAAAPAALLPAGSAKPQVRLEGGPSAREGRVEMMVNGTWRTVCDPGPDSMSGSRNIMEISGDKAAGVATTVCRQLRYGGGAPRHGFYGAGAPPAVAYAECRGSEAGLLGCSLEPADGCPLPLSVACAGE